MKMSILRWKNTRLCKPGSRIGMETALTTGLAGRKQDHGPTAYLPGAQRASRDRLGIG